MRNFKNAFLLGFQHKIWSKFQAKILSKIQSKFQPEILSNPREFQHKIQPKFQPQIQPKFQLLSNFKSEIWSKFQQNFPKKPKFTSFLAKFMLTSLACASFAIAKPMFSDKVLSLYYEKDASKEVGKLLPSNAFEPIKSEGNRTLVRISGFVNPAAPSVLYFSDGLRIMVASFAKNNPPKLLNLVKGKEGKWDTAQIEVWLDSGEFATSTKAMFAKAATTYAENCGICHTAHKESEFGANQWQATFNGMVSRTAIMKEDRWLIIEYLQKHSKDFRK